MRVIGVDMRIDGIDVRIAGNGVRITSIDIRRDGIISSTSKILYNIAINTFLNVTQIICYLQGNGVAGEGNYISKIDNR